MLKGLVSGAVMAILASTTAALVTTGASAAPPTAPSAELSTLAAGNTVQVRDRGDRDRRERYRPGRRYREAPRHWHRYHRRPRDWHRRGCIIVGPFWFCP